MKIGMFSKHHMVGGSELRLVSMANAIKDYTNHSVEVFSESTFPEKLREFLNKDINVESNFFEKDNLEKLYSLDSLLIINTDSKDFTSYDYWKGKNIKHNKCVDLKRIKQMCFLFNFLISPSQFLFQIGKECEDVRIITTNSKFFNEVSEQDRYYLVRHFPRLKLESPIEPKTVSQTKTYSKRIRIGMHSKGLDSKWNEDWPNLIKIINKKHSFKVEWNFMGMNENIANQIKSIDNVNLYKEFQMPVKDFLENLDIFSFFPSWKREEPWARSVAEGLMSSCPVVTIDKGGNKDQIINGNNGFLCKNFDEYLNRLNYLIEYPDMIRKLGSNAYLYSNDFTSESIINKYINFISR